MRKKVLSLEIGTVTNRPSEDDISTDGSTLKKVKIN